MFDKQTARQISQYIKEVEDFYFIDEQGKVYSGRGKKVLRLSIEKKYSLLKKNGKYKSISLKKLYRAVYNKEYCIDEIDSLNGEQWQEIPQTQGRYYASNKGRIKSYTGYKAIILEPFNNGNNYYRVTLNIDGKRKDILVHKIIAALFIEPPKDISIVKYDLHHIDHNTYNNKADNLLYITREEHSKLHAEYKRKEQERKEEIAKELEQLESIKE